MLLSRQTLHVLASLVPHRWLVVAEGTTPLQHVERWCVAVPGISSLICLALHYLRHMMGQAGVHGEPGGAASEEDAASSSDGQGSSYFSGEVLARVSSSPSPDNLPQSAVSAWLTG